MYIRTSLALLGLVVRLGTAIPTSEHIPVNDIGIFNSTVEAFAQRSYFYAGGEYVNASLPGSNTIGRYMVGQIYVEKLVPQYCKHEVPLVFIHGNGQTGTNWLNTPDGREGWASYFLRHGYTVYLTDQAQRGRSPWLPGEGSFTAYSTFAIEQQFTAPSDFPSYPQAINHTQWPGTGLAGDPVFDAFYPSQVQAQSNATMQAIYNNASYVALLDRIGSAIVFAHSQGGPFGFQLADARPDLVKGYVAIEPSGPPFQNYGGPPFAPGYVSSPGQLVRPYGLTSLPLSYDPPIGADDTLLHRENVTAPSADLSPCIQQKAPARRLENISRVPVLLMTSEASYHAVYDHCTVAYLRQAGVQVDDYDLPKRGIHGNGHFIFMEKNNLPVAELIRPWIDGRAG